MPTIAVTPIVCIVPISMTTNVSSRPIRWYCWYLI
jgi:hypothetical protein